MVKDGELGAPSAPAGENVTFVPGIFEKCLKTLMNHRLKSPGMPCFVPGMYRVFDRQVEMRF